MLKFIFLIAPIFLISCASKPTPMPSTSIEKIISFSLTSTELWELLTNPLLSKQYMYGSEVHSNWQEGSPLLWQIKNTDGSYATIVKGNILSIEDEKELTYTMFVPSSGMEDIPVNYLSTQYLLKSIAGGSQLTIIQTGFDDAADGMERFEESLKGWDMVIPLMKEVANTLK